MITLQNGVQKSCLPAKFLDGILTSGAGNSFDGISFHAYDYYEGFLGQYDNPNFKASWDTTGPVEVQKASYINSVLSAYHISGKYLINTESGIDCDGTKCTSAEYYSTTAYYLVENYTAALANNFKANIWYSVYGQRNRGLIENINGTLQPLSTYNAFKFSSSILSGMSFTKQPDLGVGLRAFEFTDGHSTLWIVWSIDGMDHNITLPRNPASFYTYNETQETWLETSNSQQITVSLAPIFIKYIP
jgi:hypothetical protein